MDRLLSMRVFQSVVNEGGFAAAARKLDLAPSVVTRLVEDLEQHLGARLLQRTTRRHALTSAGQAYLARLRHILEDIEEAEGALREETQELSGTIRVHAQPVTATHLLAPLIARFRALHPDVVLDIHTQAAGAAVEDFDLTVLTAVENFDANIIARPIVCSAVVLCAAPAYLAQAGEPATPADLARHALLRLRTPSNRPRMVGLVDAADASRSAEVEVAPALIADHSDTLIRATLDGAGISAHPLDLVAPYLQSGQLRHVLSGWITGRVTLYAAMASRKYVPARTRTFLEFLIEHARALVAAAELR